MTRLFFAFIALLSGLAAVQAPAHAARPEQLAYGVQSPLPAARPQGAAICAAARFADNLPRLRVHRAGRACAPGGERHVPRVLVGIDKALE